MCVCGSLVRSSLWRGRPARQLACSEPLTLVSRLYKPFFPLRGVFLFDSSRAPADLPVIVGGFFFGSSRAPADLPAHAIVGGFSF